MRSSDCGHLDQMVPFVGLPQDRKLPFAFTEHGAIHVATILNSPLAVEMSVYVERAFHLTAF